MVVNRDLVVGHNLVHAGDVGPDLSDGPCDICRCRPGDELLLDADLPGAEELLLDVDLSGADMLDLDALL
ncbi:hypothetical protein E2562_036587 [Oryza meyeriana var. granulata]|uniref:Uncharacterized protein n=1 Tax=Oryza meyeriana var. granulata TaxID=110450 RepID=A0A6G1ETB6_9ORYZ|nr:hypothetical protein E2562_036587 [Oryza meyeriana var. granulata]